MEKLFETMIWRTRFLVVLAVIFGLIGAFVLFILASLDIYHVMTFTFSNIFNGTHPEHFHQDIVSGIIGSVDLYLIAVVMLLFSFGLYELFISEIDFKDEEVKGKILEIHSLDQLKDKIAKVIVMVLVVNFFQKVMHMEFKTPLEMLYLAISICVLALGLFFLGKIGKEKKKKEEVE